VSGRGRRSALVAAALAAALFAGIQFVPVERSNPPVVSEPLAGAQVDALLRRACYDCHSNETRWPWYSKVAPVSWLVADHVREGRGQLNFSAWPAFDFAAQEHLLREIVDEVAAEKMPPSSYLLAHADARLSDADKAVLLEWAREE
jgi:hypothetical protein